MYEVFRETHRGPKGIFHRKRRLTRIEEGQSQVFKVGSSTVIVGLEDGALMIGGKGNPLNLDFGVEPERRRPVPVSKVLECTPEHYAVVTTNRNKVEISGEGDRLILQGPKFKPFQLKTIPEAVVYGMQIMQQEKEGEIELLRGRLNRMQRMLDWMESLDKD